MNMSSPPTLSLLSSTVGKKLVTGLTGLGLTLFVIGHMVGNLSFFVGHDAYNLYAYKLMSLGPLLYAIEAGLVLFFVGHAVTGIAIWLGKRQARPEGYARYASAKGASRQSTSSISMVYTGSLLLVFLVLHLISFKFGPGGPGNADPAYLTIVDGVEMRNLALLVEQKFQQPLYAFGYSIIMLLLALHLRHGVWSAMQSLSLVRPSMSGAIYTGGAILGLGIALGFIVLPLWIFFGGATV